MGDAVSILILPSPLLPERAYAALAAAVEAHGVEATTAPSGLAADEHAGDLILRWARLVGPQTVLVAHSNAGYLAPSVRAVGAGTQPIVFMDAALPPATGSTTLAPRPFRDHLAGLAGEDAVLPAWTRWWTREQFADVIPAADFADLDCECPRLPLRYFDFRIAIPEGWTSGRNAYLAFGETYTEERDFAEANSWPHASIAGGHLHFLHEPEVVAGHLLRLVSATHP